MSVQSYLTLNISMNKVSLLSCIILLILSCDNKGKYSEQGITLSNIEFVRNSEIQRYIKNIDFFVIDTTKLLISSINKMVVDNDCYILQIGKVHNEIVILKKDGSIIGRIDRKGSGPGEYKDLTDFTYNFRKKEILIFDILSKSIYSYSLNGNFNFQKRLNIQATNLITDDQCLYFYTQKLPSEIGDGREIIVFDENYNHINSFFEYPDQPYKMRSSASSVFTRNCKAEIFFSNEFRDTTYLIDKANCVPFLIYNIPNELPKRFSTDLNLYNENFRNYSNHRGYFTMTDNWVSFNLQEKGRSYDYYLSLKSG